MTRKDYVLLAQALLLSMPDTKQYEMWQGYMHAVHVLANALARDNKRFSREHFLAVVAGHKPVNSSPE